MSVPVALPNRGRAPLLEREPIRLLDVAPNLGAALATERRAPAEPARVVSTCCLQVRAWEASRLDVLPYLPSRPPRVTSQLASGGELDQPRRHRRVDRDCHRAPPERFAAMPSHGTGA
jgi:hypothetical protein